MANKMTSKAGRPRTSRKSPVRATADDSSGPTMMSGVVSAIGDRWHDAMNSVQESVGGDVQKAGSKYLKKVSKQASTATAELVAWGKKHPYKTAAAAAALVGVTALIYTTMKKGRSSAGVKSRT